MESSANKKHAYLIVAHNHFRQLQELISLLDDPRNDIYLHIDKKVKAFQPDTICVRHSNLVFIDRISVTWGGQSLISCELNLLKAAISKHYQYYHLISGVDLPLKTQDEIHNFFASGYPNNYISIDEEESRTGIRLPRISRYYFFQDRIGRGSDPRVAGLKKWERRSLRLQDRWGIRRKQYVQVYKGSNWFSITDDLAQYLLDHKRLIKRQFYRGLCADEMFLQSVAMASPYHDRIVNNDCRAIDWKRGEPYTYRQEDVEELLRSPKMFARKFDDTVDRAAIDKIIEHLTNSK